jgi:hypothetical protein
MMSWFVKNKINNNPSILWKVDFHQFINYHRLYEELMSNLGFNSLFQIDEFLETMEKYYKVKPLKLKTDNSFKNNEDIKRLKDIDDDIYAHNETIKTLDKLLKKNDRETNIIRKRFNDADKKLKVLQIREKALKDDSDKSINISQSVSIMKQNVSELRNKLIELMSDKQSKNNSRVEINKIFDDLNSEYTKILNGIDDVYGDKINYEYSNEQIEHAKRNIMMDVMSDPVKWIKRTDITHQKLLDIINIDKLIDNLFINTTLVKNIKTLLGLDLVDDVNIKDDMYYIFK